MASKKIGCLPIIGFIFVAGTIGAAINANSDGSSSSDSQRPAATSQATGTSQNNSTSSAKPADCPVIETNVTMVRNVFREGKATPQQAAAVLESASDDWAKVARAASGSRADWLKKMSDLSLDLRGYILTGSPSNGDLIFDQLSNNMNLVTQFCSAR